MTKKVIATNGFLNIVNVIYGIEDYIELDDGSQHRIFYSGIGPFFLRNGERYNLDDFIRTNI